MMEDRAPDPILVVGGEAESAGQIVEDLRHLSRVAIWVDAWMTAVEMMQAVSFDAVIVEVDAACDWDTCGCVAAAAICPVVVVTRLLAPDRRYRDQAFQAGVAAYVSRPCPRERLVEALDRLHHGERAFELVNGASYCMA